VGKYNSSGGLVWGEIIGGGAIDSINAVTVDAVGNIYIAGSIEGNVDVLGKQLSAQGTDMMHAALDVRGGLLWARAYGTAATEAAVGIALDGQGGVTLTGTFTGTSPFDRQTSAIGGRDGLAVWLR
jgi:hypothetical protein